MRFRKLRIAWSVAWGIIAVLLCVLWVRSYWRVDNVHFPASATRELEVWHARGEIVIWTNDLREQESQFSDGVKLFRSWPIEVYPVRQMKFDYTELTYGTVYGTPYWFPVMLAVIFAGTPWIPRPKRTDA